MGDKSTAQSLTLSSLPPEIYLVILSHLPVLDYYHLKLAGCRRITGAVRDVTGRLSQRKYTQQLQAEDARRKNLRPGFTRSTMEIMIERGQTTLVHHYIRKYHCAGRRTQLVFRYAEEKRVFHSALHWAVYYESESIVLLLLDQIDVRHGRVGWSALHVAAVYGRISMVELLLLNGADIDALDAKGKTPLQLAIEHGADDVAQVLRARQAAASLDELSEKYPREWPKRFGVDIRMRSRLPLPTRTWIPRRGPEKLDSYYHRMRNGTFYASLRGYYRATLYGGSARNIWWWMVDALDDAITRGCVASVSILLQNGYGLNDRCVPSPDPLRLAVSCRQVSIILLFIARGRSPNPQFFEAAVKGDIDRMRIFLEAGVCINTLVSGKTVLHHAVSRNDLRMVKYLIDRGADVEVSDPELKRTPVFEVCSSNSARDCLPPLLQAGANINAEDAEGNTPVLEAIKSTDTTLFSILLQHGANLSITDDNRVGLLLTAGSTHAVEYLLDAGVDINSQDDKGRTKLHWILCNQRKEEDAESQAELTRFLLRRGANVNVRSTTLTASTPFLLALRNASSLIHDFIQHGADLDVKDSKGFSALHIPFLDNNYNAVKALLDHGADPHARNKNGRILLHNAFLNTKPPEPNLLKLILDQKVNPNAVDNDGMTPILYAIRQDCTEHISLLLEYGAKINIRDPQGCTPLHHVCMPVDPPLVHIAKLLLAHGADIDARDSQGYTPLHHACMGTSSPDPKMVQLLFDHGVDTEARDNNCRTALHLAVKWAYEDEIKALLELEADFAAGD